MNRAHSIDVLRGVAVLMMTFSGNLPGGDALPGWMYHAQEPPPLHEFNPTTSGITWVDLVFPFFLFCMGAVVPFALPGRLAKEGVGGTLLQTLNRTLKLLLFAIVVWSFHPWRCPQLGWAAPFVGLLTYGGFFAAFAKIPSFSKDRQKRLRIAGYAVILIAMGALVFNGKYIHPSVNDPIIKILANVYLAGVMCCEGLLRSMLVKETRNLCSIICALSECVSLLRT